MIVAQVQPELERDAGGGARRLERLGLQLVRVAGEEVVGGALVDEEREGRPAVP